VPARRSQIAYMRGVCTAGQQHHRQPVVLLAWTVRAPFPHLLSYSTANFAAVGFSEGMRAGLGRGPVTVTTVVPWLMRTGSHLQARFIGQSGKEFTWFALRASLPLISIDAERAAASPGSRPG
jgi:NAD(P)-dependent dehydrogenase (short-subunit alcohol dehydrogenase family)